MTTKTHAKSHVDLEKYRLRRFVDRLIEMGEVEIHDEPVQLTDVSRMIEGTEKALLFKKAGPDRVEIVAKTAGNRKRLAAAFDTSEDKLYDEYFNRLANPTAVRRGAVGRGARARGEAHRQGCRPHQAAVLSASRLRRELLSQLGDRLHDRSRRPGGAMSAAAA